MEIQLSSPYHKQQDFIKATGGSSGVSVSNFVGGRGSGKTHAGALKLFISALTYNNTCPHLWTFPTYRDAMDIGYRTWKEVVPTELWIFKRQDMQIVLLPNTSRETVIDLRSRDREEGFRGPTYAAALNDEICKDRNKDTLDLIAATLRHTGANNKWIANTTTPKMGWFYNYIKDRESTDIYATSYDNPYVDKQWIKDLEQSYSPEFAKQEIQAQWVSQSGRIWKDCDLDSYWPAGNKHWARYDPSMPYMLALDLGVKSGWLVIQKLQPIDQMGLVIQGHPPVNVIVGEYTPNDEGAQQTLSRIEQDFGYAYSVHIGADVGTRSVADSEVTPAITFRSRGWRMDMKIAKKHLASKRLQHDTLQGLFHNAAGQRRLCVSEHLFRGDPQNNRGIRELIDLDTYPDREIGSQYFNKDKKQGGIGLEDIRDALLYWAITEYPPSGVKRIHSH